MKSPLAIAVAVAVPLVMVGLFYVWARVTTIRLGYELSSANEESKVLEEHNQSLRMERSALESPARLIRLGEELGLGPPRASQIVEEIPR